MNSHQRRHPALLHQPDPIPFPKKGPGRLELLLTLEEEIRKLKTPSALSVFAVNDTARLLAFGQAFHFRAKGRFMRLVSATGIDAADPHAPLVPALEQSVEARNEGPFPLVIEGYPLSEALWFPLQTPQGKRFGGLLFTRADPWPEADRLVAARISATIAHAFSALAPPSRLSQIALPRWLWLFLPLILLALFFIPVPMTTLAPFETIADNPVIVAAPIDGVIAAIDAEANVPVTRGQRLMSFDKTNLAAAAEVALRRELVAEAKLATARQASFGNSEAKRDLTVAEKELDLARAEREHADAQLARADVAAARSGLLIYSSRSDWIGKPVSTGERIMEIADESRVVFRLDLAVSDSIAISEGARVRLFLDSDPLTIRYATVREASFHALPQAGGALTFRIIAVPGERTLPRIGLRGTAQIVGETTSLGFFLFRRPIAAARQWAGM